MNDAGLTNGAFYTHFASKDSFVALVIADQLHTLNANIVARAEPGPAGLEQIVRADYQREVAERLHLPFQMLSDPARSLARELGLPTFGSSGLTLNKRLTLIIRDGVIEHVFHPVFPPGEHADQVLTWFRDNPL